MAVVGALGGGGGGGDIAFGADPISVGVTLSFLRKIL